MAKRKGTIRQTTINKTKWKQIHNRQLTRSYYDDPNPHSLTILR